MNDTTPTLDEWRQLYDLARRIYDAKPWEFLEETDLIGVKRPHSEDFGFVSVMGIGGEFTAISVYLGAEGLHGFWKLQDGLIEENPLALLSVPQLQLSFEDRSEVEQEDRQILKQLGLKFRGKGRWPLFRTIEAGLMPWFLRQDEAQMLIVVLEQFLEVMPRLREDIDILDVPEQLDREAYEADEIAFVRMPNDQDGTLNWSETFMIFPPPPPKPYSPIIDISLLEQAQRLPKKQATFEIGVFMIPTPIFEKGTRPYFPYVLLLVDTKTAAVIGWNMLLPLPSLDAMWTQLPNEVLSAFIQWGEVPKKLHHTTEHMGRYLALIGSQLKISLHLVEEAPVLQEVVNEFGHVMRMQMSSELSGDDEVFIENLLRLDSEDHFPPQLEDK